MHQNKEVSADSDRIVSVCGGSREKLVMNRKHSTCLWRGSVGVSKRVSSESNLS